MIHGLPEYSSWTTELKVLARLYRVSYLMSVNSCGVCVHCNYCARHTKQDWRGFGVTDERLSVRERWLSRSNIRASQFTWYFELWCYGLTNSWSFHILLIFSSPVITRFFFPFLSISFAFLMNTYSFFFLFSSILTCFYEWPQKIIYSYEPMTIAVLFSNDVAIGGKHIGHM